MDKKKNQQGFSYIEVMCAMVILLIGILGQLSALSWCVLRQRESEQQNTARQIASSAFESIFAARDLGSDTGISGWEKINTTDVSDKGIFVPGWTPVRESAGKDGIQGTQDDACPSGGACQADNKSKILDGFSRKITITDVPEADGQSSRKRRLEIKVRYFVGQAQREQTVATVISDLPFYK